MKQKDLAIIIAVIGVSVIVAFVISNLLFGGTKATSSSVEVVPAISSDFNAIDNTYFGNSPIDPTQPANVGSQNNPNPF